MSRPCRSGTIWEAIPPCQRRLTEILPNSALDRLIGTTPQADRPSAGDVDSSGTATDRRQGVSGSPPEAATPPPELAEHPDYDIVRELGRGGMGVVYLAREQAHGASRGPQGHQRALLEYPAVRDRFLREIQSAAKLQHPNIVTAYSAMRLGANIALAMEYVEGDDLAKMVKSDGPLPVANACYVIYQAALGLQHAHERGMVHRDIKPANLILGREGTKAIVKVLDFGLAKVTSEGPSDTSLTRHGQTMGTPDYIAPEQIRNSRSADIRADIYSLGCTFYSLLTGEPPFRGEHPWDVYQAHFSMNAEPLNLVRPDVPADLAALVAKMMAKAPRAIPDAGRGGARNTPVFPEGARGRRDLERRHAPDAAESRRRGRRRAWRRLTIETTGDNPPGAFLGDPDQVQGARNTEGPCRGARRHRGRWLWSVAVGAYCCSRS